MKYLELLKFGKETLKGSRVPEADINAYYLLEYVTGLTKADYYLHLNDEATESEIESYEKLVNRRAEREPVQYIIGSTEFMGLKFELSKETLIPRPDTEILVEEAIGEIKKRKKADVLDLCTGSGAIAIAVKHFCPGAEVTATDISKEALEIAKKNSELNKKEITFIRGDLLEAVSGQKFDIIISNPPYVSEDEYKTLEPEITEHEPKLAFIAEENGLSCYRRVIENASDYLLDEGYLMFEIGSGQAIGVSELLRTNNFENIKIIKDLAGLDRVVTARKSSAF